LCDAPINNVHPNVRRSMIVALIVASSPLFWTDPRFRVIVRFDAPDDAAIGCAIRASRVFLL
jgi:hypothetical protein